MDALEKSAVAARFKGRTSLRASQHIRRAWQLRRLILPLLLALVAVVPSVQAAAITYSLVDLGGGTWQYSYRVSGVSFTASGGFEVDFDPVLYEALDPSPTPPNGDWFVFTVQPEPVFPPPFGNGSYTASALVDNPSLADPFVVSFTYLGLGEPGPQLFAIFDAFFNVIETGRTTPSSIMPEPGSLSSPLRGAFRISAPKHSEAQQASISRRG